MKKLKNLTAKSLIFVLCFQFFFSLWGDFANASSATQDAYPTTYSPNGYWKCESGEYFWNEVLQKHQCKSQISASNLFSAYRIGRSPTEFGYDGLSLVTSDKFLYNAAHYSGDQYTGTREDFQELWKDGFLFLTNRARFISAEVLAENGSRRYNTRFAFYDFINHSKDAEYLFMMAGDDDFSLRIDDTVHLDIAATSINAQSYSKVWLYPVALSGGAHVVEMEYDDSQGNIGGLVGEVIGPFPKGSLFTDDGVRKNATEIREFLLSDGWTEMEYEGSDRRVQAPRKWAENRLWNTTQYHPEVNSPKKHQQLAYAPDRPGYSCPDNKKPFFKKTENGSYESVPYCYAVITDAEPNPLVAFSNPLEALTGGNIGTYLLTGTCREDLGNVALNISGVLQEGIACKNEQRRLADFDFSAFPDGKVQIAALQSTGLMVNGRDQTFSSPLVTGFILKDVTAPDISISDLPLICEYEKNLTGVVGSSTNTGVFSAFALIDYDQDCSTNTLWQTESSNEKLLFDLKNTEAFPSFSFKFKSKDFNQKKICIKAEDDVGNINIVASNIINGIATCDPSLPQMNPLIVRKQHPIDLGTVGANYKNNENLVFDGRISHDADVIHLDLQNPQKGNYVLTYTATDIHNNSGQAQRVIQVTDADPLEEQLRIANDPLTIKNKTKKSIDEMIAVRTQVQKVFDNLSATQKELDDATALLKDAIARLKRKPRDGGSSGGSGTPTPAIKPQPKPVENSETPSVKPTDSEIFNPTVEDGKCYTHRTFLGIKDSTTIQTTDEFKKALSFLWSYEMTMYDSVDGYDPVRNLSREEAAKIFSQFAMNVLCRKPDKNLKINYTDVENADPTLKPYITLAYQLGVMKGSGMGDGLFRPFDYISKAEVNAVLIRMILKSYLEEKGELWYANYNKVSESLKITQRWAGLEALSRNDLALMLFRAYKEQEFEWREIGYFSFVLKLRDLFVK